LVNEKLQAEARQVLTQTRGAFKPDADSQFDRELKALAATVR
jgi:hypothetical protein